jgi:hypothetical protein
MRRRLLAALAAWSLAASPAAAAPVERPVSEDSSDAGRVLVWPIVFQGVAAGSSQAILAEALAAGIQRARLPTTEAAAPGPCDDDACRVAAARAAGAAYVVVPAVVAADRDYTFRLRLLDVGGGEAQELAEGCPICGVEEASTVLESLGPRLTLMWETARSEQRSRALRDEQARREREQAEALARQPRVRVTSEPRGSPVFIDGEEVGDTPLDHVVTRGRHVVEIRRLGYASERREVELTPGTASDLSFRLRPLGRPAPTRRSQSMLVSGSVLTGGGLLSLGIMGLGLGIGASAEREGERLREELSAEGKTGLEITDGLADTRQLGLAMNAMAAVTATLGGVLVTVGVVLIGVSTTKAARRPRTTALHPWGSPAGAGLSLSGRF